MPARPAAEFSSAEFTATGKPRRKEKDWDCVVITPLSGFAGTSSILQPLGMSGLLVRASLTSLSRISSSNSVQKRTKA
jgi:hypothetical protein